MLEPKPNKKALVILVDGVEELEAVAPIDCLRRAGAAVTVASLTDNREVVGRNGIRLVADTSLGQAGEILYELVVIPGGPGHTALADSPVVVEILRQHAEADRLIGSICAGPLVLKAAGLLEGRAYTSHPTTGAELPERDSAKPVVRDGNIITSQGAGTAIDFGLALVEALVDQKTSLQVAASICY